MFDHVSIGVRDLARAKRFYDAVLLPLGYACLSEDPGALGYGRDKIALWIGTAARPMPPDPDSNLHFCFAAPTRAAVDDSMSRRSAPEARGAFSPRRVGR